MALFEQITSFIIKIFKSPEILNLEVFIFALFGGLLPALVWLWFWLHESYDHHEPKKVLILSFILGMLGVFLVFPVHFILNIFFSLDPSTKLYMTTIVWAGSEEIIKYILTFMVALRFRPKVFDEPIDAFVYLMTVALGFAAMENTLFLIGPLLQGETIMSIITGNMRFMGANLLHVASSGLLSLFIGYSYYKKKYIRIIYLIVGLISATLLHAVFNLLIIILTEIQKEMIFVAFSYVWITLIILILALEKVKKIKKF
jgi:protease PrsW